MEVWFYLGIGTAAEKPETRGEESNKFYTRAPPKRVGRAFALLTKTYHGSRITGQVHSRYFKFPVTQFIGTQRATVESRTLCAPVHLGFHLNWLPKVLV